MATDTTKITGAADDLSDKLTKGGSAAKTLGAEIANAIKSLDTRVTALEAGTPVEPPIEPPVEPPGGNTWGAVTGFTATNNAQFRVDGQTVTGQHASKAWNIKNPDTYTLRFEVHQGDRWSNPGYSDQDCERAEIEHETNFSTGPLITTEYGFVLEPGSANTAQWCIIGQYHQEKGPGSPPFAVALYGEKMHVLLRGPDNREQRIYADGSNIQRGHHYAMKIELRFNANGTGTCKVWRDGSQLVNYNGALGSGLAGETYYWKQGVYRETTSEVMAAVYDHLHITAA